MSRDQQYGTLERGKRADFFLVPGDPSKDISAVRQIQLVMKNGVIYYPEEIYEALGIKPFAKAPAVTPARSATSPKTAAASAFAMSANAFGDDGEEAAPTVAAMVNAPAPPKFDLTLKPHTTNGAVDHVDVTMLIEHPNIRAGETFVRMPLVVASIPTTRYDGDAVHARDAEGDLPLTQKDLPPSSFLSNRDWLPTRATSGDVTLTYRALPRAVTPATRIGPLFDLREENGGLHGAGWAFLVLPINTEPYSIHLHWDLSKMPPGARGVWSLGEGDVTLVKPAGELGTTFYFAGPVKSYPSVATGQPGRFVMYWLSDPPFDVAVAASMINKLFDYVSAFFHDDGGSYRVFMRKQPAGGGGTALTRSFMFGYNDVKPPTADAIEALIAHEMVHNWPTLEGDHADVSWYTEGAAEYYSTLLSYRSGAASADEFIKRANERASGYYLNPLQTLTNRQADEIYWKDARAGHVPYNRGFMYLASVDAQIRAKSHSKRSLDDVVLKLLDRGRHGQSITVNDWQNLVVEELGPSAKKVYEDMVAGKLLIPPLTVFAPCFRQVYAIEGRQFEPGFDVTILATPTKIIKGVIPGSAAAVAGLRDGDAVVQAPDLGDPTVRDASKPVEMNVRRGADIVSISYVPEGQTVKGYHWERNPKVSNAACEAARARF
jgi:hypothetical protein